jgi:hypothetical protein
VRHASTADGILSNRREGCGRPRFEEEYGPGLNVIPHRSLSDASGVTLKSRMWFFHSGTTEGNRGFVILLIIHPFRCASVFRHPTGFPPPFLSIARLSPTLRPAKRIVSNASSRRTAMLRKLPPRRRSGIGRATDSLKLLLKGPSTLLSKSLAFKRLRHGGEGRNRSISACFQRCFLTFSA